MASDNYKMSFSTGGLFIQESVVIAEAFQDSRDWKQARDLVLNQNLLQARTESSLKRTAREATFRLQRLDNEELDFMVSAQPEDQAYLLWLAVCRYYQFIGEFALEVLHDRYVTLKGDVNHIDFDLFFDRKAEWDDDLAKITDSTRGKLRQVLFRMMREAGLLDHDFAILPALFGPQLFKLISQKNSDEFTFFPTSENALKRNFA